MLEAEIDNHFGYGKHEVKTKLTPNSRKTVSASMLIRKSLPFETVWASLSLWPSISILSNVMGIEEQIVALYAKGVSTRDTQDHLQNMYGIEVSPTLISNATNKIVPLNKELQNHPLQGVYAVVYLDENKDVGMWIGENESSKFWLSVLNN
uniref:transposase n=1 Tax=Paenibacillus odorifer TaxID=189426 RepID=UPI0028981E5E|nr:transposase [Paenibacillus odorifer]